MITLFLTLITLNSSFIEENKSLIKDVESTIESRCNVKLKKIDYSWMPLELEKTYLKNEYARFNFGTKIPWIEFSSKFKELSYFKKKLNIFHEIGHVFGLEHEEEGTIMNSNLDNVVADWDQYYKVLCPAIVQKK